MHPELIAIREEISRDFSEESLDQLELLVTRYAGFLERMSTPGSDCSLYTGRLRAIEESLEDARYGNNEGQRERGYHKAVASLLEDTQEFTDRYSGDGTTDPITG